jgi:hypothetical protein
LDVGGAPLVTADLCKTNVFFKRLMGMTILIDRDKHNGVIQNFFFKGPMWNRKYLYGTTELIKPYFNQSTLLSLSILVQPICF